MTTLRKPAIIAVLASILCSGALSTVCEAQKSNQKRLHAPLWGALSPGLYSVGYRVIFGFDRTRTWRVTRALEKQFSPDSDGRPVRVSVWYPAVARPSSSSMRILDYVHVSSPQNFAEANAALERRDRRILAGMVPPEEFQSLLDTKMAAVAHAPAARGPFPVVLYSGGINPYTLSNAIMAEFLASHGYIVVAVPSLGQTNHQPDQVYSPIEMEASVRDLEFAWSLMREQPHVNDAKLAVFGHSLGGTVAMIFAMRNANVAAVAGLDGTYGFDDGPSFGTKTLTEFYGYAPQKMRAAVLDIHRSDYTTLDLSAVHAFHHSDRYLITLAKILHADFTTFAAIKQAFHIPPPDYVTSDSGYTTEVGYQGFQRTCRIVRDFFEAKLKGDPSGIERLTADVRQAAGAVMTHKNALPTPPSAHEFVALIADKGFDAAVQIVERFRRDAPGVIVVDQRVFNRLGYNLIAEKRFAEAIGVLRLVSYVYPKSWNAADSLGDAYITAGQKEEGRAAYQRAINLAAADPDIDPDRRKSIIKDEQTKLEKLKP